MKLSVLALHISLVTSLEVKSSFVLCRKMKYNRQLLLSHKQLSWDISASKMIGFGLLLLYVHTSSETYPVSIWISFFEGKASKHEADHSTSL
jgi:hypothetical protein